MADGTHSLEPLELAILQIAHGLTIKGRLQTDNLLSVKRTLAELKRADPDGKGVQSIEDYVGWQERQQRMRYRTLYSDAWLPREEQNRVFLIEKAPSILIRAELRSHKPVMRERMGLSPGDDIQTKAEGAIRALCLRLLLKDDGEYKYCHTAAYIRPDGCHVCMEAVKHPNGNVWWNVNLFSEGMVSYPGWLNGASPDTIGDCGSEWLCWSKRSTRAYALTSAGLAAITGLPEILDPNIEWPPPEPPTKLVKKGEAGGQGDQPEHAESAQGPSEKQTTETKAHQAPDDTPKPIPETTSEVLVRLGNAEISGVVTEADAKRWCTDHGVRGYSREEWKTTTGNDPPRVRGNPRFYDAGTVTQAIAKEKAQMEQAEEAVAEQQEAKKQARLQKERS